MSTKDYAGQARGDTSAYDRYLAGMDASMRQKVALTAALLLAEGTVADMGMGSGGGSQALAALYPRLHVIGVDVDAGLTRRARETHRLPNLEFRVGDIAEPVFPEGSLDGVFNSSVLHHVTTFNGYDADRARAALATQLTQLKLHGTLIVRDFIAPDTDEPVLLDVPANDGEDNDDPRRCSTARLLERFAGELRLLSPRPGFSLETLCASDVPDGWRRYRLTRRQAAEFLLRKDYRTDWESEVEEEYTYFTQAQFESTLRGLGLRVLASQPLWNPWILRNRFEGKCALRSLTGEPLELPATHCVMAGEKVAPNEGVAFREGPAVPALGFLQLEHHRHRDSGQTFDQVRRPFPTLDLLPYFADGDSLYVMARMSYPRPILSSAEGAQRLDSGHPAHYVTEPLNVLMGEAPLGAAAERALVQRGGFSPQDILGFTAGSTYYPSPGGIQEEVRSAWVEVKPRFVQPDPARTTLSTMGRVRAIEAQQLLRAAQVGGLPDARLELNVYDLLLTLGRSVGPWIGETVTPGALATPEAAVLDEVLQRPHRRKFERSPTGAGFLTPRPRRFQELDGKGQLLFEQVLEYVVPARLSCSTVACALIARGPGASYLLGVDDDDLPAAQAFNGNSELLVAPAWRLPEVTSLPRAQAWIAGKLQSEYGLTVGRCFELGGAYYPSPGLTPEVVHPLAVEVKSIEPGRRPLVWLPLEDVVRERAQLRDGHLRIAALRVAHALGVVS